MHDESTLPADLIQAYLETEYRVDGRPELTLRIEQHNVALAQAHQDCGVSCSAYITAWNPHSESLDDAENDRRQAVLARELQSRNLAFLAGIGQHPNNQWPGEASYLIFGLDLAAARALAGKLGQNGFVWCGSDAEPQLILLR